MEHPTRSLHHVTATTESAQADLDFCRETPGLRLVKKIINVTEVRDRCYFRSIYFREPGGVLFEAATVQPGFTVDEELRCLGRELKLPPWEEPHRRDIEAGLVKVTYQ